MEFSKRNKMQINATDEMFDADDSEVLLEASGRIRGFYQMETGRALESEVISLIFEDGEIIEIRTDINETIFEQ
jgi:hypothetical protein